MSKIKIVFYLALAFIFYKGFVAFQNFEIGVDDRVASIEEKADFEKEGEVIGLMMYLGDPPELFEHLLTKNKSRCLEMKQTAVCFISKHLDLFLVNKCSNNSGGSPKYIMRPITSPSFSKSAFSSIDATLSSTPISKF